MRVNAELVPLGYWLAHIHWMWEAEREGRGEWVRAPISELPPHLQEKVREEIRIVGEGYGYDRAPDLWRLVTD